MLGESRRTIIVSTVRFELVELHLRELDKSSETNLQLHLVRCKSSPAQLALPATL